MASSTRTSADPRGVARRSEPAQETPAQRGGSPNTPWDQPSPPQAGAEPAPSSHSCPEPGCTKTRWLSLILPNFNTSGTFTRQHGNWNRGVERVLPPEPAGHGQVGQRGHLSHDSTHSCESPGCTPEPDTPGQPCCFGNTKCKI